MFTFNSKEQPARVVESPCADTIAEHDPNLITDTAEIEDIVADFVRKGIDRGMARHLRQWRDNAEL